MNLLHHRSTVLMTLSPVLRTAVGRIKVSTEPISRVSYLTAAKLYIGCAEYFPYYSGIKCSGNAVYWVLTGDPEIVRA